MNEEQTDNHQNRATYSRWIWRSGLLAILILLLVVVVPIAQNGRTIQKLKSINDIKVITKPGRLLESMPYILTEWLYQTFDQKRLTPFETVSYIDFSNTSINDADFAIVSQFNIPPN
ncbi:MAG: hypothetical protein QM501_15205 [Gimesia sp.]